MSPLDYTTDVSNNNLVLLSINLQSINAKFSELNELITLLSLKKSEPDIICVQELWQFPSDADFSLSGYHKLVYKLRRNHVQGGGVGIYIKSNLNFNVNVKSSIFVDRVFESILVDISIKSKIITVGSIYRPSVNHPTLNSNQQFEQFLDLFNNLLSDLSNSKNDIYLLGDYNIDLLKINTCSKAKQYVDTFFSYGFLQTITKPTRCTNSAATLIDHCITNVLSPVHISNIITCKLSDHFPFIYTSFCPKPKRQDSVVSTRDYSSENILRFREMLSKINWNFVTDSNCPQESYNLFSDFFNNMFDLYFPVISKKFNKNFAKIEKWCTNGILISRRNKLKLANLASNFPSHENTSKFKCYRNLYNKIIKHAKKLYYENELAKNQSDLKKTWQLICQAIKRKPKDKSSSLSSLRINDADVNDPCIIANCLNDFFATAPKLIVDEISQR